MRMNCDLGAFFQSCSVNSVFRRFTDFSELSLEKRKPEPIANRHKVRICWFWQMTLIVIQMNPLWR